MASTPTVVNVTVVAGQSFTVAPCPAGVQGFHPTAFPQHGGITVFTNGTVRFDADANYSGLDELQGTCPANSTTWDYRITIRKPAAPVTMTFKESCVVGAAEATAQLTFSIRNRDTAAHLWSITSTSFPKASGDLAAEASTTATVTFTDASATVRTRVDKNLVKTKVITNHCTPNDPIPIPGGGTGPDSGNSGDITPSPGGVGGGGTGGGFLTAHRPHRTHFLMRFM